MADWHEQRSLPWIKVHLRLWTSDSHADLGASTLGCCLALMMAANRLGRRADGSGAIVSASGAPMSHAAMARLCHASEPELRRALRELMEVGTLVKIGPTYVFPGLQKWQENPAAARMRKSREAKLKAGLRAVDGGRNA